MIDLGKKLEIGGRLNLSKSDNGEKIDKKIFFGANWGAIRKKGGFFGGGSSEAVDLDASIIVLDGNKKKIDVVYFGKKTSSDGAIQHSGDDLTGDTDGDDGQDNEVISIDLSRIDSRAEHLVFVLNSYRHQQFDEIPYMGLRIYTTDNNRPSTSTRDSGHILAKFDLKNGSNDPDSTFVGREAIILGDAYRKDGEWKFKVLGRTTHDRDISSIVSNLPNIL